jgi:L-malate glycosyltransferase
MKILHMLDSLNRGGAESLCLDVCRNAAGAGFDLTFVASGSGDLENDFANSGVDFIRLDRRLPIDPILVNRLRTIIRDVKPAVAHAQQAVEAIHLYLATRGTDTKCVMSLQNYILDTKNRIATKWIVPKMDAVCPVSYSMQEWFRTGEGFTITDRYHVLPNGVDPDRLKPVRSADQTSLREELNISPDQPLAGMVGNFYPDKRKDQLTICRALSRVMAAIPSLNFVFVGSVHDGAEGYLNECKAVCRNAGIADRVHFVGKRSDIPDVLAELDLFVFSSVQEGLPVASVEALLMGVPMLVSDIPPLLDVSGNIAGRTPVAAVFRTGDSADLAEKIIELFNDKSKLAGWGKAARVETPKIYSIESHLARLREIYEAITVK